MDKILEAIANNIIVFGAFLVPIGIVAVSSYFSHKRLELVHRERMAAIEKGLPPMGDLPDPDKQERERKKQEEGRKSPPDYLRTALFWLCPGLGMVAFSLVALEEVMPGDPTADFGRVRVVRRRRCGVPGNPPGGAGPQTHRLTIEFHAQVFGPGASGVRRGVPRTGGRRWTGGGRQGRIG